MVRDITVCRWFGFVGIELIVLIAKGESLHYYAPRLGYMLSEGIRGLHHAYIRRGACVRSIACTGDRRKEQQGPCCRDARRFRHSYHSYFRGLVFESFSLTRP